jgi:hypothetical protein
VTTTFEILTSGGSWSATPDNYSSMRYLQFSPDGTGRAVYGYGQTIHAMILFRFGVAEPDRLELEYLESPGFQRFKGFHPDDTNGRKRLAVTLTEGERVFVEGVTGFERRFRWMLDLDAHPYPEGLTFPFSVPTTFYGHVQRAPGDGTPR